MGKYENVLIFNDTDKIVRINNTLRAVVDNATANQKVVLEEEKVECFSDKYAERAKVIVSKKRTLEAAADYLGMKTCVLNFASATNPGGGVVNGSSAQEEAICRCSTLYFNLNTENMWSSFYGPHRVKDNPLHNDDIIYTPEVCVFKTDTYTPELMKEEDWYYVNVITCAAPNLREKSSLRMNEKFTASIDDIDLYNLHVKRLKKVLDVALSDGNEVVILGAFGCGAFRNNPNIVARAARDVISGYLHSFKVIEYAVFCTPNNDTNYWEFKNALSIYE